ncbi:MAG: hypothetical protein JXN63_07880 [Candidatus Delongbacteria bacterium]|nr:hypothetical protein [Candidatus Delongbacteria bacterium]
MKFILAVLIIIAQLTAIERPVNISELSKSDFLTGSKGQSYTGTRIFKYSNDEWVFNAFYDLVRDTDGTVLNRKDYNSSGTLVATWTCDNYDEHYRLRHYKSSSWESGSSSTTKYLRYSHDDVLLSYEVIYFSGGVWGSQEYSYLTTYTYDNGVLVQQLYVYDASGSEEYWHEETKTEYNYDVDGKLESEYVSLKICNDPFDLKERTLWTWDGNDGTGINEGYKNTVWINKSKKLRGINQELKPVDEYRSNWSWGYWIEDDMDTIYYNSFGNLYSIIFQNYDPSLKGYVLNEKHNYYYDDIPVGVPANFTSIVSEGTITLTWDPVNWATSYKIYSSDDPYGVFEEDSTGNFNGNEWSKTIEGVKKFYRVTAVEEEK